MHAILFLFICFANKHFSNKNTLIQTVVFLFFVLQALASEQKRTKKFVSQQCMCMCECAWGWPDECTFLHCSLIAVAQVKPAGSLVSLVCRWSGSWLSTQQWEKTCTDERRDNCFTGLNVFCFVGLINSPTPSMPFTQTAKPLQPQKLLQTKLHHSLFH